MRKEDILKPFAITENYDSEFHKAVRQIRRLYTQLAYDHKPYLCKWEREIHDGALLTEEFRVGHACFKLAVSLVIQPRTILEIGVRAGGSAMAFLTGTPFAHYTGLDNREGDTKHEYDFIGHAEDLFIKNRVKFQLVDADSQMLSSFHFGQSYDFIHIDGDHTRAGVAHDVAAAIASGPKWILLDDCRDTSVLAGFADGMRSKIRGCVEWAYFEETWTGNILVKLS